MKAVQIGILVALLLCAGLLFKIYRGQHTPAAATASATQTAVPAATPALEPPAATLEANPQVSPSEPAQAAAPARRKPSPAGSASRPAVEVAQNQMPDQAPQMPPAPAQAEQPAPAPQPAAALYPPPGTQTAPPEPRQAHHVTIPAGTLITVRLAEELNSSKNHPGDAFSATLDRPIVIDGFAIAERGARVQGKVVDAQQAGRVKGVSQLSVQLVRLHTADGQDVPIATEKFAKEGDTSHGSDAKKVGGGAALGAIIGAIAGGGKGAAIGAGAGGAAGGGVVLATRGKPVDLPVETRLTFRLQEPVNLTERID